MAPAKKHATPSDRLSESPGSTVKHHERATKHSDDKISPPTTSNVKQARNKLDDGKHFPFLKLPGELRNKIYEYALVDPESTVSITLSKKGTVKRKLMTWADFAAQHTRYTDTPKTTDELHELKRAKNPKLSLKWFLNGRLLPGLLQVCREIHDEALPILYARNHFLFLGFETMYWFARQCGEGAKHIEVASVAMLFPWRSFVRAGWNRWPLIFREFTKFTNLKALILEQTFLYSFFHGFSSFFRTDHIYRILEPWFTAVAARKGGSDHALDLLFFPESYRAAYPGTSRQLQVFEDSHPERYTRPRVMPSENAIRERVLKIVKNPEGIFQP